jgi:hypothetical protein
MCFSLRTFLQEKRSLIQTTCMQKRGASRADRGYRCPFIAWRLLDKRLALLIFQYAVSRAMFQATMKHHCSTGTPQ